MTQLSPLQQSVVNHRQGPALVLAGPGSGKTTVITSRALAISREITSPARLLCVTFTRKAGEEMELRYRKLAKVSEGTQTPIFMTVHAFCNKVVGEYEKRTGEHFTRIEGDDSPKEEIISRIYVKVNHTTPNEAMVRRIISYIERKDDENVDGSDQIRRLSDIVSMYREYKAEHKLMDFGDMILMAKRILESDALFRTEIASRFDYIQVDEAQDLSRVQYEVLNLIALNRNILIVADDDQSIYRFRGADPKCIFDFVRDYEDAKRYDLSRNYRSTKNIVASASKLIQNNKTRFDKKIYTEREEGARVEYLSTINQSSMAKFASDYIQKRKSLEPLAILYRNNHSALILRLEFTQRGITYELTGENDDPLDNVLVRFVLDEVLKAERRSKIIVPTPAQTYRMMKQNGKISEMLDAMVRDGAERSRVNVYDDFMTLLCEYARSHKECIKLIEKMISNENNACERPRVQMSTVHSAKGLEWDEVWMIDLIEDEFPGSGVTGGEALEEERRLFYVGMTRARNKLVLIYPQRRGNTCELPSRFIKETYIV